MSNVAKASPQMDLHATACISLFLGKDLCSVGKSNTCQLFEGKGDFVWIHTVIYKKNERFKKKILHIFEL